MDFSGPKTTLRVLQGALGRFKRSQEIPEDLRGASRVSRFQGVSAGSRGFQKVSREFQGSPRDCRGFQGILETLQGVPDTFQ